MKKKTENFQFEDNLQTLIKIRKKLFFFIFKMDDLTQGVFFVEHK